MNTKEDLLKNLSYRVIKTPKEGEYKFTTEEQEGIINKPG